MDVLKDIQGLKHYLSTFNQHEKSAGFIPTMGALHEGHLELVRASKKQNDMTICSIFVNPTQFNNPEDLENYPRDTPSDLEKLKNVSCDAVFIPSVGEMYSEDHVLNFNFGYLEEIMEGKFRPGHFGGVGLIVTKLFNLVKPTRAYFGTKDLQQLAIIKKLAKDLLFDIEIIPIKTVRESDGLAMSSRNKLLSNEARKQATDLYNSLNRAREKLNNQESVTSVKKYISDYFETESAIDLEYFEVVYTENLHHVSKIHKSDDVSLCIAGYLGKVRLIDNISLN